LHNDDAEREKVFLAKLKEYGETEAR